MRAAYMYRLAPQSAPQHCMQTSAYAYAYAYAEVPAHPQRCLHLKAQSYVECRAQSYVECNRHCKGQCNIRASHPPHRARTRAIGVETPWVVMPSSPVPCCRRSRQNLMQLARASSAFCNAKHARLRAPFLTGCHACRSACMRGCRMHCAVMHAACHIIRDAVGAATARQDERMQGAFVLPAAHTRPVVSHSCVQAAWEM